MRKPNNLATDMTPQTLDYCLRIGLDIHTDREDYLTYKYLVIESYEIIGYHDINNIVYGDDHVKELPYLSPAEFIKTCIHLPIFTRKPR